MAKQIKTDINELVEWIGATSWDSLEEYNEEYVWSYGDAAMKECESDGGSEEDCEEAREEAWLEAQTSLFEAWKSAVEEGARYVLDMHELELVERKPGQYVIKPQKNVRSSLKELIETINGVGHFHFSSVKELLDSGPYSPTEALAGHWRWAVRAPEVYGTGSSALRKYESSMEDWSR